MHNSFRITKIILIFLLLCSRYNAYAEKQIGYGERALSMIWMLSDDSVIEARISSVDQLSDFLKSVDHSLVPYLNKLGSSKDKQRALFIALRPDKQSQFWFEPPLDNLDSKFISELNSRLQSISAPTVKYGPIAMSCILASSSGEQLQKTQPLAPLSWLDVVKEGGGKISMDQLLNHLWKDTPAKKNDSRPIIYSSLADDIPFFQQGVHSIYGSQYLVRDIDTKNTGYTAEVYKHHVNFTPQLICPSGTPSQGNVIASFVVPASGTPQDIRIYHSSNGLFESVAVPLLGDTQLEQAKLNGHSIPTIKRVEFLFRCVSSCPYGENIIGDTPVCVPHESKIRS